MDKKLLYIRAQSFLLDNKCHNKEITDETDPKNWIYVSDIIIKFFEKYSQTLNKAKEDIK